MNYTIWVPVHIIILHGIVFMYNLYMSIINIVLVLLSVHRECLLIAYTFTAPSYKYFAMVARKCIKNVPLVFKLRSSSSPKIILFISITINQDKDIL